jgi:hypothetical protein
MSKTESKTEISKIVITVDDKKIELTAEQARKLKHILGELFGVKEIVKEEHHYHDHDRYYPHWNWDMNQILCAGTQLQYDNSAEIVSCSL